MRDVRLTKLFEDQHGVAADRQLRAIGVSWSRQQRWIADGTLRAHAPGVVALAGAPQTWHQRCMAATLSVGGLALLSGASAARLHRFDGYLDASTIEVAVPHGVHVLAADGVRVRRVRGLSKADRHVVDSVPVTIQPVTLIHLAADGLNAAQALDSALRQGKSPAWFRQHFERWQVGGRCGPTQMLQLLDDRMGKRLPRSWFQRLAKELLDTAGIQLVDEWPVHDDRGKKLADLDLACVEWKVGLECQSIEFHATAADIAKDIRRKRALRRQGWDIIELWWSDLHRMGDVLEELSAAIDRARRLSDR